MKKLNRIGSTDLPKMQAEIRGRISHPLRLKPPSSKLIFFELKKVWNRVYIKKIFWSCPKEVRFHRTWFLFQVLEKFGFRFPTAEDGRASKQKFVLHFRSQFRNNSGAERERVTSNVTRPSLSWRPTQKFPPGAEELRQDQSELICFYHYPLIGETSALGGSTGLV